MDMFHSLYGNVLRAAENVTNSGPTEEAVTALSILLILGIVAITFMAAYVFRELKIHFLHESSVAILLGLLVGLIVSRISEPLVLRAELIFSQETFFLFLLPPIIFASGYNLDRRSFFNNLGSLLVYAFLGTLINNLIFAGILYAFNFALSSPFSFVECLVYGAILSATDPVTVLAIFKELRVDNDLYANVFGESVLNDAMAIVLYKTFSIFLTRQVTVESVFLGIGSFLLILVGSSGIGLLVGLWSALFFKYTKFYHHVVLEGALIFVFGYCSFLLAEGLALSGIISILMCGISMGQYTVGNLSEKSRLYTKEMFEVLSTLSETVIFCYLGFALFSFSQQWDVALIFISIFALLVARMGQVAPLTGLINAFRWWRKKRTALPPENRHEVIPMSHIIMLWFAGLRGALAFALSLNVPVAVGGLMRSSTLIICVFTIFVLGSFTAVMLRLLRIRTGVSSSFVPESKNMAATRLQMNYLVPFFSRPLPLTLKQEELQEPDVHDPALVDEWAMDVTDASEEGTEVEMRRMATSPGQHAANDDGDESSSMTHLRRSRGSYFNKSLSLQQMDIANQFEHSTQIVPQDVPIDVHMDDDDDGDGGGGGGGNNDDDDDDINMKNESNGHIIG